MIINHKFNNQNIAVVKRAAVPLSFILLKTFSLSNSRGLHAVLNTLHSVERSGIGFVVTV